MTNEEHLVILRQGVAVWNQWRVENPDVRPSLGGADLLRTTLQGADFRGADLHGVNLSGADLRSANFSVTVFPDATFEGWSSVTRTSLQDANLQDANFRDANLIMADLTRADLTGASLQDARLRDADLQDAKLYGVDFQYADLSLVKLRGARLSNAIMGFTTLGYIDLRNVQGLDAVHHRGPSTLGTNTLYVSQGDIPERFLRGCGVPESMIEYARSLVAAKHPIDYYSVFISYSSQDEAVAERLHADLQSKGVRCWYAPHDLEIGEVITRGIDEAIRIYDKLLIILSEASVNSHWVAFEVNTALHREVEQGRPMLFPIRLDDTVLHMSSGWAAQLRSRHIGDFRGWKDHDRYQVAFARLLRDLKAKEEAGTEESGI